MKYVPRMTVRWRSFFSIACIGILFQLLPARGQNFLPQVLEADGRFTNFVAALRAAGVYSNLLSPVGFTGFVPNDEAFAKVPAGDLANLFLPANVAKLEELVYTHLALNIYSEETLNGLSAVNNLLNQPLVLTHHSSGLYVSYGKVVQAGVAAQNGVIHVLGSVLFSNVPPVFEPPPLPSLLARLTSEGSYTQLLNAISVAGLTSELSGPGPVTLLAPNDAAFNALPPATLASLLLPENQSQLQNLLRHHFITSTVTSNSLTGLNSVTPVFGPPIQVGVVEGVLRLNEASLVAADLSASNGVVHGISQVLVLPPPPLPSLSVLVNQDGRFTNLWSLLTAAGLQGSLESAGPLTLLAPTDQAFSLLSVEALAALRDPANLTNLQTLLLHHFLGTNVSGGELVAAATLPPIAGPVLVVSNRQEGTFINDARVSQFDLRGSNGLVHVIERVLVLPPPPPPIPSLLAALTSAGEYSQFLDAIALAGLSEIIRTNPITVFAPNNSAFNQLPPNALVELLAVTNRTRLTETLLHHIVEGSQTTTNLSALSQVNALAGPPLKLRVDTNGLNVDDALVTSGNQLGSNGWFHAVNRVLTLPPLPPIDPDPTNTVVELLRTQGRFTNLLQLLDITGLTSTLRRTTNLTVFAPNDDAFAKLSPAFLTDLLSPAQRSNLTATLLSHVVVPSTRSNALNAILRLTSLQGAGLNVITNTNGLFINTARFLRGDSEAPNGLVHELDTVLFPPRADDSRKLYDLLAVDGRFTTLVKAFDAAEFANLIQGNDGKTLFAATDVAFGKLSASSFARLFKPENKSDLQRLLRTMISDASYSESQLLSTRYVTNLFGNYVYAHSVSNRVVINSQAAAPGVISAVNGFAYPLDALLSQPSLGAVLSYFPEYSEFFRGIQAAGYENTLTIFGPYTLAVPVNSSFTNLPPGFYEDLLKPANLTRLRTFLGYHIVRTELTVAQLRATNRVISAVEQFITLSPEGDTVRLNDATVTERDLLASNGRLQQIGRPLIAPSLRQTQSLGVLLQSDGRFTQFLNAIYRTGAGDLLNANTRATILAPTDAAFALLPAGAYDELLQGYRREQLRQTMYAHTLNDLISSVTIANTAQGQSISGYVLNFTQKNGVQYVNDAAIIESDLVATNGLVHVLDKVIQPFPNPNPVNILGALEIDGRFTNLLNAVRITGISNRLTGAAPMTLFAPTDVAFGALPKGTLDFLLRPENKELLTETLLFHIVAGNQPSADLEKGTNLLTVNAKLLSTGVDKFTNLFAQGGFVLNRDYRPTNGTIHVVAKVLFAANAEPTESYTNWLASQGRYTNWLRLIQASGLVTNLSDVGPFTFLAPVDSAFTNLPASTVSDLLKPANNQALRNLIRYHWLPGARDVAILGSTPRHPTLLAGTTVNAIQRESRLFINQSAVIESDLAVRNGLVQSLDRLLTVPSDPGQRTAVDFLAQDGRFSRILNSFQQAGLSSLISTGVNLTLFVPTDAAWTALTPAISNQLATVSGERERMLRYHLVAGRYASNQLAQLTRLTSTLGRTLVLTHSTNDLFVNRAQAIETDLVTTNGWIHIIDRVLLPDDVLELDRPEKKAPTNLRLTWSGGTPPYVLQRGANPTGPWTIVVNTTNRFQELNPGTTNRFFRVVDSSLPFGR